MVEIIKLLQKNWVCVKHVLQNKLQLVEVIPHKVIASETCFTVDHKIIFFLVKYVIRVQVVLGSLAIVSYHQCHE